MLPGKDLCLKFAIAALAAGPIELDIRVFVGGSFLGEVSLPVSVNGRAVRDAAPNRIVAVALELGAPVPGSATLSIDYDSASKRYKFGLSSERGTELWTDLDDTLYADLTQTSEQITMTLNALARGAVDAELTVRYLAWISTDPN